MRTILFKEYKENCISRTNSAQFLTEFENRKMRFPKTIKHRRFEATIYGKSEKYAYYRLAYYAVGKRHVRNFKTYSKAKTEAERVLRDLASGSPSAALTADQSRDALTAFEMLEAFRQAGGRRVSLPAAISEFVGASKKLGERSLHEAADGFLKTVAVVSRKDIGEAVTEFLQAAEIHTKAKEGQRAQLSAKYAYNRQIQLRKFADAFHGTAVCDLTKGYSRIACNRVGSRGHARTNPTLVALQRGQIQWFMTTEFAAPRFGIKAKPVSPSGVPLA